MKKIECQNEVQELIKNGCGFWNFMGGTSGDPNKPVILSTNNGDYLFERNEIDSTEYRNIEKIQAKESEEYIKLIT